MALVPYTGSGAPPQEKRLAIKPRMLAWTSRVWRASPEQTVPMFKIEARLDPRDIEDRTLADALRPYTSQLQKLNMYLVHTEEMQRLAPWAVGRLEVDAKSAYMFFHDFLGAANGMLMLNLMQTAGAASDIILSVVPVRVEADKLQFAISDYDFGLHARIA